MRLGEMKESEQLLIDAQIKIAKEQFGNMQSDAKRIKTDAKKSKKAKGEEKYQIESIDFDQLKTTSELDVKITETLGTVSKLTQSQHIVEDDAFKQHLDSFLEALAQIKNKKA